MKVDFIQPTQKEQTEIERKDYCAAIFAVFPRIKKDIQEKISEHLIANHSIADNVITNEQEIKRVIRGQGIIEGMAQLLELWASVAGEYEAMSKQDKEKFDKHTPVGEV